MPHAPHDSGRLRKVEPPPLPPNKERLLPPLPKDSAWLPQAEVVVNLLIFAGLLAVGLLAILGIVWAIRSEPSAAQNVLAPSTPTAATTPTVPISLEKSTVSAQTRGVAGEPPSVTETFPGTREVERSVDSEEESFPISNGQLHELVTQLQTLHQQSQELERRLSVLTNMVEHIQRSQNSRLSIEEVEELDTTEVPSAR